MIILYHGDMDGIASCNIFIKENMIRDTSYRMELFTYKFEYDKQDAIIDMLKQKMGYGTFKQELVFVDCCPNEKVLEFCTTKNFKEIVVLDHHISNKPIFDKFYQRGEINGLCYVGVSATLLVWSWFHFQKDISTITLFLDKYKTGLQAQDESPVPFSIRLINSWDIWDNLRVEAEPYKTYFEAQNFNPLTDDTEIKDILYNKLTIKKAVMEGLTMIKFFHQWSNIYCQRYGYPIKYKKNNFFVLNIGNANSKVFGNIIKDYDAVITYCNNGIRYTCSIYASDKSDFDCAKFAEQFGGGGHQKAAEFTFDELPIWLRDRKLGLVYKEGGTKDDSKRKGRRKKENK